MEPLTNTAINGSAKLLQSAGTLDSPDVDLIGGHSYQLTIAQNSQVTLRSVPEPGSMQLVGPGLAAATRPRRS